VNTVNSDSEEEVVAYNALDEERPALGNQDGSMNAHR